MEERVISKEQQTKRTQAARSSSDGPPRVTPPESGPVKKPPGALRKGYTKVGR